MHGPIGHQFPFGRGDRYCRGMRKWRGDGDAFSATAIDSHGAAGPNSHTRAHGNPAANGDARARARADTYPGADRHTGTGIHTPL